MAFLDQFSTLSTFENGAPGYLSNINQLMDLIRPQNAMTVPALKSLPSPVKSPIQASMSPSSWQERLGGLVNMMPQLSEMMGMAGGQQPEQMSMDNEPFDMQQIPAPLRSPEDMRGMGLGAMAPRLGRRRYGLIPGM